MATLEIHDGRGKVSYFTISRDRQVIFGTDPRCEIVLTDPGVLPYHGRISWRRGRYKVEAFPESRWVEVDGKKVVSASFRQGSEIRVGEARIFLITPDDGPANFEKTRVRPGVGRGPAAGPSLPAALQGEVAPPSLEEQFEDVEELLGSKGREQASVSASRRSGRERSSAPTAMPPSRRPWLQRLGLGERPPGEERVLTSPLILGLVVILGVLVALGLGLYQIIGRMVADRRFEQAMASYEAGEYRNAIPLLDAFQKRYPTDRRASRARRLQGLAMVRQYTGQNPAWPNALEAAEATYKSLKDDPEYGDVEADLAKDILEIATGLAIRATTSADAGVLALSERAVALHDMVGGQAAAAVRARSRFPEKLEAARAAVTKARVRRDGLAEMDRALSNQNAGETYEARDRLVARYPDLGDDPEVIGRLRSANELIRSAVQLDTTSRPGIATSRDEPLGPPLSLVYRSELTPPSPDADLIYALAEGYLYGLDGRTGAPIWHKQVGLDSPFPPRAMPGLAPALLLFEPRDNELVKIDGRTGRTLWRQGIGERVDAPPLVRGNQLVQSTVGGRLLLLNLDRGDLIATADLGRPLTQTPLTDELGRLVYVPGREDIVFILTVDPLECVAVEYVGHDAGSLQASPTRVGNYFIVPENHRPDRSRWSIFILGDSGRSLQLKQRQEFPGWLWSSPASAGSVVWAATDSGGIEALSVGPYEEPTPFKSIARVSAESSLVGPAYSTVRSDREMWVASGRSGRYDLDIEASNLSPRWTLAQAGSALAPIQVAGSLVVLTQQPPDLPGVMLWGVDPTNGAIRWRTLLGAPWSAFPIAKTDGGGLVTLDAQGADLPIPMPLLESGGFVTFPLPSPATDRIPPGRIGWARARGKTFVLTNPASGVGLVRSGPSAESRPVQLPSPPLGPLIPWGEDLLLTGSDGRIYRIDPASGTPTAEPLLPPFQRDGLIRWLRPIILSDEAAIVADRSGVIRRLVTRQTEPRALVIENETKLDIPIDADPAGGGEGLIVLTTDNRVRALTTRDLSASGAWDLSGSPVLGPVASGDLLFVGDSSGKLLAFDRDARRLWEAQLPAGSTIAGPPAVIGEEVWLTTSSCEMIRLSRSSGSEIERSPLDVLPVDGPIVSDSALILPTAPGTLQLVPRASR